jgi:hypothetical protein
MPQPSNYSPSYVNVPCARSATMPASPSQCGPRFDRSPRDWVPDGIAPGREALKRLQRENSELKRTNEILTTASRLSPQAVLDRPAK